MEVKQIDSLEACGLELGRDRNQRLIPLRPEPSWELTTNFLRGSSASASNGHCSARCTHFLGSSSAMMRGGETGIDAMSECRDERKGRATSQDAQGKVQLGC